MPSKTATVLAKSILSPASGYLGGYDYTVTPYLGCSHACSYCYVPTLVFHHREAKTWGQLVVAKINAPQLLLQQAKAGKLTGKRIYLSPNTDPYLPEEKKKFHLTHQLLEVLCDYPPQLLVIQTRSPYVQDDIDLLKRLGQHVVVAISITTDRDDIRKIFEPLCASIQRRVNSLATLHAEGIRTQASLAPLLPCDAEALAALVDPHCDWVVAQALKMGAGARTWAPALAILKEHGWEGWLQGGKQVQATIQQLAQIFGERYHQGREGFNLRFLADDPGGQNR